MAEPLDQNDPTTIGEYELLGRLGEGGFGVVYLAQGNDEVEVAVKVLRPELSRNLEVRERLRREALLAQSIVSARVAKLISSDIDTERPYLVMERVDGSTLDEHIGRRGPLRGALLTSVALAVAEALDDIHRSGVLHRDLKPSNVMIGSDGVKILDFGIAAVKEAADFTQAGVILGSAVWMSPEQIIGSDIGEWSDVFAMGLVLAYAALGRHPYGEGRPEAVMYRIDNGVPDLSGIPDPLHGLIASMLTRDPASRPSASTFVSVLSGQTSSLEARSDAEPSWAKRPEDSTRIISSSSAPPVSQSKPPQRKRKVAALLTVSAIAVGVTFWGVGQFVGSGSDNSVSPPPTDLSTSTTSSGPVQVSPTTTVRPTTVVRPQVATTTLPPVPVYKFDEEGGKTFRWNPCQNPISIWLNNSDGSLFREEMVALGGFLRRQATELSEITGHLILYRGLTDERTSDTTKSGEKILIQVSAKNDGLLRGDEYALSQHMTYDRVRGGTLEVDAHQAHIRTSEIIAYRMSSSKLSPELVPDSKQIVMYILGSAFGLARLNEDDFRAYGVTRRTEMNEQMFWPLGSFRTEWGAGDRLGMRLAQMGGCF